MSNTLTDTQRTLLRLLADSLFGATPPDSIADPAALWREANIQAVFLLALQDVDVSPFPPEIQQELHDSVKAYLARNLRIARGHAALSALLEKAGVPHVLIKGFACSAWYPAPELRLMGDVDFYVDRRDVERTEALLLKEGYEPEKMSHGFHHVFEKDGVRYELHFDIPGIPVGDAGKACRACFRDLFDRSSVRRTTFGDMRLPSAYHHGLITLLHMAHHLTISGIGLRHVCDWAVFVETLPEEDFLNDYGELLKDLGLWRFACCLTDICVRYLGASPKSWAREADTALSDALLADFFAAGNFGQKNVVRSRQAYLITSGKKTNSKVRRFFTVMLDMIYQKWPISKKIKLLVPVGWAYYTLRYLYRAAVGKRPKLYARQALRGAQERTGLYDRLCLFNGAGEDI